MPDLKSLRYLILCLFVLLGGACTPSVQTVPDAKGPPAAPAPPRAAEASFFSAKDAELFQSALSHLRPPARGQAATHDYAQARADLETLLNTYPKSKWRPAAE